MPTPIPCMPKSLPRDKWTDAARLATSINPVNHAPLERLAGLVEGFTPTPERIAAVTTKYWHTVGVRLGVSFLDDPPEELRRRILAHMNAWAPRANVQFVASDDGEVRIARGEGGGHWSYVGTDILSVGDKTAPTMNLDSFTMEMPESEFHRVVRHETGHTLGFPHEHMRAELVALIDRAKAIPYYEATQGWSEAEVDAQVLTPLEEGSLLTSGHADPASIMCYQIPGVITVDGKPILGGSDIDETDYAFAARLYPPSAQAELKPAARAAATSGGGVLYFAPGTDPAYVAAVVNALRNP